MTLTKKIGAVLIGLPALAVVVLALFGPWMSDKDPNYIVGVPYSGPSAKFLLGTDFQGRDVLTRVLDGGRPLVLIPVLAVVVCALVGALTGTAAGYLGGVVDAVVSRVDNLALTIPGILTLLILLNGWGYSSLTLIAVVTLTGAPFVSRIARATTQQVMQLGYVETAVAQGESSWSVIRREILPNIVRPILADAGTRLVIAVGLISAAGFLGFAPDAANWGAMVSENVEGISLTPWGVVAPAVCLAALAVSANLVMDRFAARIDR